MGLVTVTSEPKQINFERKITSSYCCCFIGGRITLSNLKQAVYWRMDEWSMDGLLAILRPSVISGRCSDDSKKLCAMELRSRLRRVVVVVVVALLFYVHGKHLRSCRDGHLT